MLRRNFVVAGLDGIEQRINFGWTSVLRAGFLVENEGKLDKKNYSEKLKHKIKAVNGSISPST